MTSLLILLLTIVGLGQACNLERNMDYPGGDDLDHIEHIGEADCAKKCYKHQECDYWSFHPHGQECWLKKVKNQPRGDPNRVSGDKACGADCSDSDDKETGIDYPGDDTVESGPDGFKGISEAECMEKCAKDEKCNYWSYSPDRNICWLKEDKKRANPLPDRVSGKKKCEGCNKEPGIDYPLGDMSGVEPMKEITDENSCAEKCFKMNGCNFWSYSRNEKKCWLKSTKGKYGFIHGDPDRISGNRACGDNGDKGDTNISDDNKEDNENKGDTNNGDDNKHDNENKGDTNNSDGNKEDNENKGDTKNSDGNKEDNENMGTNTGAQIVKIFSNLGNLVKDLSQGRRK